MAVCRQGLRIFFQVCNRYPQSPWAFSPPLEGKGDGDEAEAELVPLLFDHKGGGRMIVPFRGIGGPPDGGSASTDHHAGDELGRGEIQLTEVTVGYGSDPILANVSLQVERGDFVCVEGPSGAGKTTLLRLLYGSLLPRSGSAVVDGVDLGNLRSRHVSRFRRRLGCVFQSYELLPHLTARQNVLLPLQLAQMTIDDPDARADQALEVVGLADKADSVPSELSGGQQQRVAIARAIAHEPSILLADEPTGNLDSASTEDVMRAFRAFHHEGGTVVMATHDETLRDRFAERVVRITPRAA
jgi:cell division transport system ATP-binding protein